MLYDNVNENGRLLNIDECKIIYNYFGENNEEIKKYFSTLEYNQAIELPPPEIMLK
jgi:hypothetical protein